MPQVDISLHTFPPLYATGRHIYHSTLCHRQTYITPHISPTLCHRQTYISLHTFPPLYATGRHITPHISPTLCHMQTYHSTHFPHSMPTSLCFYSLKLCVQQRSSKYQFYKFGLAITGNRTNGLFQWRQECKLLHYRQTPMVFSSWQPSI